MSRIVGTTGVEAVVTGRVAALLERQLKTYDWALVNRGKSVEVDEVMDALHRAAVDYRGRVLGAEAERTMPANSVEPAESLSPWMTPQAVGNRWQKSSRWVQLLAQRELIEAKKQGRQWLILRESVIAYEQERAA